MTLVDTSVWADHLRARDGRLSELLAQRRVLSHPFVIGEIAMGTPPDRERVLDALLELPRAQSAIDADALRFINRLRSFGLGIGFIDAHLLVAVYSNPGTELWTRDRRLRGVATQLNVAMPEH